MSIRDYISIEMLNAARERHPVQRLFKAMAQTNPAAVAQIKNARANTMGQLDKPKCAHQTCAGKDCLCKCHGGTYVAKSLGVGPVLEADLPAHLTDAHGTRGAPYFSGKAKVDGMGRKIDLAALHGTDHRMWQKQLTHHHGPKAIADGQEKLKMSLGKSLACDTCTKPIVRKGDGWDHATPSTKYPHPAAPKEADFIAGPKTTIDIRDRVAKSATPKVVHECPHCGETKAGKCEHSNQRSHADDIDQLGMEKGQLPRSYVLHSQKTGRSVMHSRGMGNDSSFVTSAQHGENRGYSSASAGRMQRMAQRSTGPIGKVRQVFGGAPKIYPIAKSVDELPVVGKSFEAEYKSQMVYDPRPKKKLKKPQAIPIASPKPE